MKNSKTTTTLYYLILSIVLFSSCKKSANGPCSPNSPSNDTTVVAWSGFPSTTQWGTLAFEDNWPKLGDGDMNDLVLKYRFTYGTNAKSKVVKIKYDVIAVASGASFHNGFGIMFPFSAGSVKSVTGQRLISDYIVQNPNGTEAGQTNAVIIPFDNHEALLKNYDGSYFLNVYPNRPKVASDTAHIVITLKTPMAMDSLGKAPYNPFLISDRRRGYEIHLPGYAATDKADKTLFDTDDDATAKGKSYTAKNKFPWVLSFTKQDFNYVTESTNITKAYLHFTEWNNTNGTSYADWYTNLSSQYRNSSYIYK